jgi:hypothetical protein
MRIQRGFLCCLVLAAAPTLGRAQVLSSGIVDQINASTRVRVRLREGRQGNLYAPRADSMSLTYDRGEFLDRGGRLVKLPPPLSIRQLAEIKVAQGSHAGSGARIGAGVGAGLAILAIVVCQGTLCQPSSGEAAAAVVVWTVAGAGVGALIGSLSPRWHTVYAVP